MRVRRLPQEWGLVEYLTWMKGINRQDTKNAKGFGEFFRHAFTRLQYSKDLGVLGVWRFQSQSSARLSAPDTLIAPRMIDPARLQDSGYTPSRSEIPEVLEAFVSCDDEQVAPL